MGLKPILLFPELIEVFEISIVIYDGLAFRRNKISIFL